MANTIKAYFKPKPKIVPFFICRHCDATMTTAEGEEHLIVCSEAPPKRQRRATDLFDASSSSSSPRPKKHSLSSSGPGTADSSDAGTSRSPTQHRSSPIVRRVEKEGVTSAAESESESDDDLDMRSLLRKRVIKQHGEESDAVRAFDKRTEEDAKQPTPPSTSSLPGARKRKPKAKTTTPFGRFGGASKRSKQRVVHKGYDEQKMEMDDSDEEGEEMGVTASQPVFGMVDSPLLSRRRSMAPITPTINGNASLCVDDDDGQSIDASDAAMMQDSPKNMNNGAPPTDKGNGVDLTPANRRFLDTFHTSILPVAVARVDWPWFDAQTVDSALADIDRDGLTHNNDAGRGMKDFVAMYQQLNDHSKLILLNMVCRNGTQWIPLCRFRLFNGDVVKTAMKPLLEQGFVLDAVAGDLPLSTLLALMSMAQMRSVGRIFKMKVEVNRERLMNALLDKSNQKNVFGILLGDNIKSKVIAEVGDSYRLTWPAFYFFQVLLYHYAPDFMAQPADKKDGKRFLNEASYADTMCDSPFYTIDRELIDLTSQVNLFGAFNPYELIHAVRLEEKFAHHTKLRREPLILEDAHTCRSFFDRVQQFVHREFDGECAWTSIVGYKRRLVCGYASLSRAMFMLAMAQCKARNYVDAQTTILALLSATRIAAYPGKWYERLVLNYNAHLNNNDSAIEWCERALGNATLRRHTLMAIGARYKKMLDAAARTGAKKAATASTPRVSMLDTDEELADKCKLPEEPQTYTFDSPTVAKHGQGDGKFNIFVGGRVEKVTIDHYLLMKKATASDPANQGELPAEKDGEDSNEVQVIEEEIEDKKEEVNNNAVDGNKSDMLFTHGIHTEGGVWHALFVCCLYDVIFTVGDEGEKEDKEMLWWHDLQLSPLDFHDQSGDGPSFTRSIAYKDRMEMLGRLKKEKLCKFVNAQFLQNRNRTTYFGQLESMVEREDCVSLAGALGGVRIRSMIEYKLTDYAHLSAGMPDLCLWHADDDYVKGPGDVLSAKQRLWLEWFAKNQIDAHLCTVKAVNNRRLGGY